MNAHRTPKPTFNAVDTGATAPSALRAPTCRITFDRWSEEYRVPGPKGTEAQAYYTDDRTDAEQTARAVWGANVRVVWSHKGSKFHAE